MKPIPIHVTFTLSSRRHAVRCDSIEQARELRDRVVYSGLARHPRINKQGRMHGDPKLMTLHRFVKVF